MNNINVFKNPHSFWSEPIMYVRYFFRSLHWAWQRAKYGFADYDLWDMDRHIAMVMWQMLNRFADIAISAPDNFFDEGAENEIERWQMYLRETASHFLNVTSDPITKTPEQHVTVFEKRTNELHKALEMLEDIYFDLWN